MLTQEQYAVLKAEAATAGLSLGELVRRALDQVYLPRRRLRVRGWELSFALWRRPDAAVVGRRVHVRTRSRQRAVQPRSTTRDAPVDERPSGPTGKTTVATSSSSISRLIT